MFLIITSAKLRKTFETTKCSRKKRVFWGVSAVTTPHQGVSRFVTPLQGVSRFATVP